MNGVGFVIDSIFYFNMLKNIISTFFQNGIWVVGFFYFFLKVYENAKLQTISKYVMGISLVILFIYSVLINI